MLFYDHKDRICYKLGERRFKILDSDDIFILRNRMYTFDDKYFIPTETIEGEVYKYYDRKVHKDNMNIVSIYDVGFDEEFLKLVMN